MLPMWPALAKHGHLRMTDCPGVGEKFSVLMKSTAQTQKPAATTAVVAVTVIAAATLIGAWIFQYGFDIVPCELCLEQRYAYYFVIPAGALACDRGVARP